MALTDGKPGVGLLETAALLGSEWWSIFVGVRLLTTSADGQKGIVAMDDERQGPSMALPAVG